MKKAVKIPALKPLIMLAKAKLMASQAINKSLSSLSEKVINEKM